MKQEYLPPMFHPDKNCFVTNLDTYQKRAFDYGWTPLRIANDGKKISTIYLTQEGQSLYADFDTKTECLISNVDRSVK
jgi:hypothetical protein